MPFEDRILIINPGSFSRVLTPAIRYTSPETGHILKIV